MLKTLTFIRGNAIALLALFVALAGTSYAALNIPAGSVGTRQLRNGAVTGRKLAKHAVSAANFDRQSIAGYVAAWAHVGEVGANRDVIASRPQATVSTPSSPSLGITTVTWRRSISTGCFAIANPTDVAFSPATAYTFGLSSARGKTSVDVYTFDGRGGSAPENVDVVVICSGR